MKRKDPPIFLTSYTLNVEKNHSGIEKGHIDCQWVNVCIPLFCWKHVSARVFQGLAFWTLRVMGTAITCCFFYSLFGTNPNSDSSCWGLSDSHALDHWITWVHLWWWYHRECQWHLWVVWVMNAAWTQGRQRDLAVVQDEKLELGSDKFRDDHKHTIRNKK